ncbi:hypothetical protein [Microbacterium immunditiarum]|uniref:Polysaccharide biosynthesis protein n=1 Tax=Microbacterium immunditiarum TaxID=337480 RepID=A0A7Y9GSZ7_9MICO|nr:hypothetical protein [Microbacterium immunditiarum]NYE21020.1 hypothetical protein [Microbacterium immunditiarum]
MTAPTESRRGGLALILAATAIAGVCGYLLQLLAPALIEEPSAYLAFSIFWSTLYLFLAAIAGVQQEVTRATRPAATPPGSTTLRTFTILGALGLTVTAAAVGAVLAPTAFSEAPAVMTAAFALGLVGYLLTAVLSGVLYGLSQWRGIALLMTLDAVVRAAAVTVGLVARLDAGVLAILISLPFSLAFGVGWLVVRGRVVGRFRLDVRAGRLTANAARTVGAAAATGVMVTGLPLLMRTLIPDADVVELAGLVLMITITRAPLVVPLMALQSFLIVEFRDGAAAIGGRLLRLVGALVGATAVLALAAAVWGPWLIEIISSGRYHIESLTAAGVVVSGGLVALLFLTGPALLAENRHGRYVAGWAVAAAATVAFLLVPLDTTPRVLLALLAAPALGAITHLTAIRTGHGATSRDD